MQPHCRSDLPPARNFSENLLDTRLGRSLSLWRTHHFDHLAALILLLWSITSSLWIYPHSLSYFNETIGGPLNGPEHLLGSNVDWGQDLRYILWSMDVKEFDTKPENRRLAFQASYNPQELGFPESYSVREEEFESLLVGRDGQEVKVKSSLKVLSPVTYWLSAEWHSVNS